VSSKHAINPILTVKENKFLSNKALTNKNNNKNIKNIFQKIKVLFLQIANNPKKVCDHFL